MDSDLSSSINVRYGRTLLWATEVDKTDDTGTTSDNDSANFINKTLDPKKCETPYNLTESLRLDSELRQWLSHDKLKLPLVRVNDDTVNLSLRLSTTREKINARYKKYEMKKKKRSNLATSSSSTTEEINAVQVFSSPFAEEQAKLFDEIGRRDDTFYIVWFNGDRLLLPALDTNSTTRPRISIILPAPFLNGRKTNFFFLF